MSITVDIAVEAEAWSGVVGLDALVRGAVDATATETGLGRSDAAEVSMLLCDDAAIRRLNRQWRGKDTATNVLSFPAAGHALPGGPRPLGDIAIAFETVAREAVAEGKPFADHLVHLIVHGVLHLRGFDHESPDEAAAMEDRERRILAGLGIADPYAGSDPLEAVAP